MNQQNNNMFYNQNSSMKSFDHMNQEYKGQYERNNQANQMNGYNPNENMYNTYIDGSQISSTPPNNKNLFKNFLKIILIFLIVGGISFASYKIVRNMLKKNRTFMIYMVGSDLESKSKQGTYSISEIIGENIDLSNNNVILMVGGSTKWHNFVNPEEIGIYKLKKNGFNKIKTLPIESMGKSENLTYFLDYVYKKYPAKKYDLIFWNHGLGAMGIEQDEVSKDYLSITELDRALSDSKFNDNKLELTLFYNCLASNYHIAKVMSKYSDYMVASEEVFYLSKILNRLNFLEKVEKDSTAVEIGKLFIEQSDKVVKGYNDSHIRKLDSTLSILDLNKISDLDEKLNSFIESIDINKNYYNLTSARRKLFTFGTVQTKDYDVVDLYEFVTALQPYSSDKKSYASVTDSINDVVVYTSNFNDHSNGLSIYFPYYGSDTAVEIHLASFNKLWDDSYTKFVNTFYGIRSGAKRAIRTENGSNINYLTNIVEKKNNGLSILLTDKELEKYKNANTYLFKKENDRYVLLLKTDKVELDGNRLNLKDNRLIYINDKVVTSINDNMIYTYGNASNGDDSLDVINIIEDVGRFMNISQTTLNSGDYPCSGLIDLAEYEKKSFYNLSYKLVENGKLIEDWLDNFEKETIEFDDNFHISLGPNSFDSYYVMVELFDDYNDVYYSNPTEVK